ncbi:LysR family transcriptional regulator [Thiotrichales bacterium 19S3-7]|nr:LysR family transcriptional regulator [Thiotrichales bacterium 19S3-7]MCF6801860.1 LysR family transcriptional regulator [Thiotrichales bacterium 19S3-11]
MITLLQTFLTVSNKGSFSKAAQTLGLSVSMVSRRIDRLENELDTVLFIRNTRSLNLTQSGHQLLDNAPSLLKHWQSVMQNVSNQNKIICGNLKIGIPNSITYQHITQHIKAFMDAYPDLTIQLYSGNHLSNMIGEQFDVVIHCSALPDSRLNYTFITNWRKVLCATKSYFDQYTIPKHPIDLAQHNCIDHYYNYNKTWRFIINSKSEFLPVSGTIQASTSLDLKNLALSGLGLVYLPEFVVAAEMQQNQLISVLDNYMPDDIPMYAVYQGKLIQSPKISVFIDFFKKTLKRYNRN